MRSLFEIRARASGATVTEAPYERPWGIYSGGTSRIRMVISGRLFGTRKLSVD